MAAFAAASARRGRIARWLLAVLAICVLASGIEPTSAADSEPLSTSKLCHAFSDLNLTMAEAPGALDWVCDDISTNIPRDAVWLRFADWNGKEPPRHLVLRNGLFERITISQVSASGVERSFHYWPGDAQLLKAMPRFALPLPPVAPSTTAFLVRIERPLTPIMAQDAQLVVEPRDAFVPLTVVMIAMAAGVLVMPLLMDISAYLALRERFVVTHAGLGASFLAFVLFQSGIAGTFSSISMAGTAIAAPFAWAMAAGFIGLFIVEFMEKGVLPRWLDRLVRMVSFVALLGGGISALLLDPLRPSIFFIYTLVLVPLTPIYLLAIGVGLKRGSRAAMFLAAGWGPTFVLSAGIFLRGLGLYEGFEFFNFWVFFAFAFESIVFSLGVADRFLSMRRERDQAIVKARTLKQLSERDSLTGLLNRRVIEDRFAMLREEGFCALAVVDLDHFKRINDTLGHATGDKVLKVVGKVLQGDDEHMMAFRMGGEEFVLLLRGGDCVRRAEERRQQIARAIAMEDLGCLVTASMGLIELSGGALHDANLSTLYARADRLLYQAKASGRNRMVNERIRVFQPRTGERRVAA